MALITCKELLHNFYIFITTISDLCLRELRAFLSEELMLE